MLPKEKREKLRQTDVLPSTDQDALRVGQDVISQQSSLLQSPATKASSSIQCTVDYNQHCGDQKAFLEACKAREEGWKFLRHVDHNDLIGQLKGKGVQKVKGETSIRDCYAKLEENAAVFAVSWLDKACHFFNEDASKEEVFRFYQLEAQREVTADMVDGAALFART